MDENTLAESSGHALDEASETPGQSVRDMLRAKRAAASKRMHLDLEVPGFGGMLKVRYGPIPSAEFIELSRRIEKVQTRGPEAVAQEGPGFNADLLIRCCQGILTPISADEGAPFDVRVDESGDPLLFNSALAEFLDVDAESAREVVYGVFGNAPSPDMAVGEHVERLMRWLRGAEADVDQELSDF